jgi:hypothetical protein
MSAGEPLQQGGWPARDYRTRKKGTPPGRWRSHLSFATIVHPVLASSLQRSGSMQKSRADRSGCRIHPDAASRKPARICETPGLSKRLTTPVVRRSPLPDCAERGHRRGRAGDRFGPAGGAEAGHCFGDEGVAGQAGDRTIEFVPKSAADAETVDAIQTSPKGSRVRRRRDDETTRRWRPRFPRAAGRLPEVGEMPAGQPMRVSGRAVGWSPNRSAPATLAGAVRSAVDRRLLVRVRGDRSFGVCCARDDHAGAPARRASFLRRLD